MPNIIFDISQSLSSPSPDLNKSRKPVNLAIALPSVLSGPTNLLLMYSLAASNISIGVISLNFVPSFSSTNFLKSAPIKVTRPIPAAPNNTFFHPPSLNQLSAPMPKFLRPSPILPKKPGLSSFFLSSFSSLGVTLANGFVIGANFPRAFS